MTTTTGSALADLDEALAILRELASENVVSLSSFELESGISGVEELTRLAQSLGCRLTAEAARRARGDGRSTGSTAKELGGRLGVSESQIHDRIAAGSRAGSAAFEAFSRARITAQQEKKIAESLDQVPEGVDDEVRRRFEADLVARAEEGAGPWQLARFAEKVLIRLDAGRLDRKVARQNKNRHASFSAPSADGTFTLSIRCTAEMKAMTDSLLAQFARPGACVPVVPFTPRKPRSSRARVRLRRSHRKSWIQSVARFPTVVSCAGCMCVKPSVGKSRYFALNCASREITSASFGRSRSRPSRTASRSSVTGASSKPARCRSCAT